jgi:hypothetical protein
MSGYYSYNKVGFQLVTAPTNSPITVADVKSFLKVDNNEEDVILDLYISAAVNVAQNYTGKAFITQTRKLQLDCLPDGEYRDYNLTNPWQGQGSANRTPFYPYDNFIELPYKPILTVTSIVFTATDNTTSTFSSTNYYVDTVTGRVILNDGATWDVALRNKASVAVTYTCGYGATADLVPADIRMALLQHVADMYNCRSVCGMSCGCEEILSKYRDYGDYSL